MNIGQASFPRNWNRIHGRRHSIKVSGSASKHCEWRSCIKMVGLTL